MKCRTLRLPPRLGWQGIRRWSRQCMREAPGEEGTSQRHYSVLALLWLPFLLDSSRITRQSQGHQERQGKIPPGYNSDRTRLSRPQSHRSSCHFGGHTSCRWCRAGGTHRTPRAYSRPQLLSRIVQHRRRRSISPLAQRGTGTSMSS